MKLKSNTLKVQAGCVLLFFMLSFNSYAQFPYSLKGEKEASIIGVGAIMLGSGFFIQSHVDGLTTSQIQMLDPKDVNRFDRNFITNYSEQSNQISETVLFGTGLASLSLLADKSIRDNWLTAGVMGVEVLMLTYGVSSITKGLSLRARPYAYNENVPLDRKLETDARYSFFSQSTAATAGISFYAAKLYSDTHPNSKWKPLVWGGAILLPAITGVAKVSAGEHFATDVMVGYSLGALIGYFVPVLHYKKEESGVELKLEPQANGLSMRLIF